MHAARLVRLAALVVVSFVAFANAVSQAALIHHWRFDEPNGLALPQVHDSVGGNHGAFANLTDAGRSNDVPLPVGAGRSLGFDGVNQAVTLTSQIALPHNTNFSVSMWYRGTDLGMNGDWGKTLLGRDNNDLFSNLVLRNGYVEFIRFSGGWQHNIQSTTLVADGQWHHIAFVNHSDGTGDLYIDGAAEILGANSTSSLAFPFRIDHLMRGFNNTIPGGFTGGLLDDVRIYDHALSEFEVMQLTQLPPVPEPSTFVLLAAGAVGITLRSRRRHNG